jgi:hypothetical protein
MPDHLLAVDLDRAGIGLIRPRMHFSSTDLPVPEPPMTTIDSPGMSRSTPSSTWLAPKLLVRPRMRILGGGPSLIGEEHLGDEVVEAVRIRIEAETTALVVAVPDALRAAREW